MFWDDGSQIIYRQAKKDLKITLPRNKKLSDVKLSILKELRKKSNKELLNEESWVEVMILKDELHNIDNFVSVRFAFYALVLAVVVLVKDIKIENYLKEIITALILILISFRYFSDNQKDRLLYYKFKLNCIEEILNEETNTIKRGKCNNGINR